MKQLLLLASLALSHLYALAQTPVTGKITGQVNDDAQKLVEFANVTLHKAADSSLVKATLTDTKGFFELGAVKEGQYYVNVSQMGYQRFRSPVFNINADHDAVQLSTIQLATNAKRLGEVTVRSTKPFVERQVDKTVLNIENSITAAGSTAMEVLEKAPGITVDADGNIAMQGRQGVLVMIDNKPTYLSANDLATMLKGMSASQIEKIEIITNPSARYDASGNAGIINIRMKKDQRMGMNGSANLSLGQGLRFKQNAGLNLNLREKKWNWFANLTQVHRSGENRTKLTRNFRTNDVLTSALYQEATQTNTFSTQNLKVGADYSLSKKTTIGATLGGIHNDIDVRVVSQNNFNTPGGQLQSRATTRNANDDQWLNLTANLNIRHTFDSTGRELSADVDYLRFDQVMAQQSITDFTNAGGSIIQDPYRLRGDLPSIINIITAKSDYIHPISKKLKFEAGLKSSFVTNDGNAQYFLQQGNSEVIDQNRTNHFIYEENINAGYLNVNQQFKKLSIQLGLRGEQTIAKGNQVTTNQQFSRNYFQVFPTIYVRQEIDKNNAIGYTFGRRIQRPDYQSLNPFRYFLDLYTYREGNPELQPQFTYNSEVTYTFKQQYSLTVYRNHTNRIISTVFTQNDITKEAAQTQKNLDNQRTVGFNTFLPLKPAKWWNCNAYVEAYNTKYSSNFLTGRFDRQLTTFFVNANNTFTLGKTWSAEMTAYYQHNFLFGTFEIKPQAMVAVGAQKTFWERKGTVKVNVSDVFLTQRNNLAVNYQNVDMDMHRRLDSRYATIAFSYRFGNSKMAPARRRNSGAEDENRRVRVQES